MKMFLISDNIDTYTGFRLSGVEGVVVHTREEVKQQLDKTVSDKEIGIIVVTEKIMQLCTDLIDDIKISVSRPLIVSVPDRHGREDQADSISKYIREAIGIKL